MCLMIIIGFQEGDRQDSQNLKNDTFCRLPVTSAQCFIGMKKYVDAAILLNYDDVNDYSQGDTQIEEFLRTSTEDDVPQP